MVTFDIIAFTKDKLKELGLYGWQVGYNNAKSYYGLCHHNLRRITFSKYAIPLMDEKQQKLIAIHEIAHAVVGNHQGHNQYWRKTCIDLGGNGERLTYGIAVREKHYKYLGVCPSCQTTIKRYKRDKIACGACCKKYNNNKFTTDYLFKWSERGA